MLREKIKLQNYVYDWHKSLMIFRIYNISKNIDKRYEEVLHRFELALNKSFHFENISAFLREGAFTFSYLGLYALGFLLIYRNEMNIDTFLFLWPLAFAVSYEIYRINELILRGRSYQAALMELVDYLELDNKETNAELAENVICDSDFERLVEEKVFEVVKLIEQGCKKILIKGPSGCGKTTVLRKLCGLLGSEYYLDNFYYSNQKPLLFAGTVLENLLFEKIFSGKYFVDDENDIGVVNRDGYGAHNVFSEMSEISFNSDEYSYEIGVLMDKLSLQKFSVSDEIISGGRNLSTGEKARLALCRAFLDKTEFLLLDEPCAALDPLNKSKVYDLLELDNRVVVMVSHDEFEFSKWDKVIFV